MGQQLLFYLHMHQLWQKQYQQEHIQEYEPAQPSQSTAKSFMSRTGKFMVNMGEHLQTISTPMPKTQHSHS